MDKGASWTPVNAGLTSTFVFGLTVSGTHLFACTGNGIFVSTDDGGLWNQISSGLKFTNTHSIAVDTGNILVGTAAGGVWWRPLSEVLAVEPVGPLPVSFLLQPRLPQPLQPEHDHQVRVAESITREPDGVSTCLGARCPCW